MHELTQWHNDVLGQRAVEALTKHNFSAYYFADRKEAVDQIMQLIPPGATVGLGGSRTGMELGLWELLAGRGHEIFNHNQEGLTPEERVEKRYKSLPATYS
nr:LUD domain-containing protein [Sporomusa sp. KB1]